MVKLEVTSRGAYLGFQIEVGDIDGNGNDDMALGSYGANTYRGTSYVFYGPVTSGLTMNDADAQITGSGTYRYASRYLAEIQDLDGDGDNDLMIDERSYSLSRGAVAAFDEPSGSYTITDADSLFVGPRNYTYLGYSFAAAGEANGDGEGDAILGA